MNTNDSGWVIQRRLNARRWWSMWWHAGETRHAAIQSWGLTHGMNWAKARKMGVVRCVRCHAEEVTP
jgi:hypothetical protein